MNPKPPDTQDRFRGVILGAAVGDALGLPMEGLSAARIQKMHKGPWRHRFILNRGMTSDDTDHTVFVAQSLIAHPENAGDFSRRLARCLKWWLASLPAGIGFATLRSILKLWVGFGPRRSGVFSAGNGPAMRSAPVGAFFASEPEKMDAYLDACTRITHTDPKALTGAKAVAYMAAWSIRERLGVRPDSEAFLDVVKSAGPSDNEWLDIVSKMAASLQNEESVSDFAERLGQSRGVSGYAYHSVPVAVYAWHRHFGDYYQTLGAVMVCGGDTDTVGAMAGAMAGAVTGEQGIPVDWIDGILEWPRGVHVLRRIADELAKAASDPSAGSLVSYPWPAAFIRNLFFTAIVLLHGFRRLLPPF